MSKKICKKCGVEKDFSEFYTSKKNKDGLQGTCKKCKNMKYSFTCAFLYNHKNNMIIPR